MMHEYTEADVARLAEMIRGAEPSTFDTCARRLLEQGVTLPPDPAVVVAEVLWQQSGGRMDLTITALRDLFPPEALAEAAAKIVTGGGDVAPPAPRDAFSGGTAAAKVQEAGS